MPFPHSMSCPAVQTGHLDAAGCTVLKRLMGGCAAAAAAVRFCTWISTVWASFRVAAPSCRHPLAAQQRGFGAINMLAALPLVPLLLHAASFPACCTALEIRMRSATTRHSKQLCEWRCTGANHTSLRDREEAQLSYVVMEIVKRCKKQVCKVVERPAVAW